MMKKRIVFISATALLLLSACSSNKGDQQKTIEDQQQQIETLTHEKKQLESLLQTKKETPAVQSSASSSDPETEADDLEGLFKDFIYAEFEQDNETLSELTTATLYTMLTDNAGQAETDILFQSKVKSIDIYKAEQTDDAALLVAKIEIETKVGEFAPSSYEQLIECTAERNTNGVFQIATQALTNLAQ